MTDELLFRNLDYFNSLNVPYCIINNTLLGIYRDNKVFPGEARQTVFLVPADRWSFIRGQGRTYFTNQANSGFGAVDMNDKICVNFYTEVGDKIVINPSENKYFVYAKDTILPFSTIRYRDRDIPAPHNIEKYLSEYYGAWKEKLTETQWNWVWSKFIIYASSPEQAAEGKQ